MTDRLSADRISDLYAGKERVKKNLADLKQEAAADQAAMKARLEGAGPTRKGTGVQPLPSGMWHEQVDVARRWPGDVTRPQPEPGLLPTVCDR